MEALKQFVEMMNGRTPEEREKIWNSLKERYGEAIISDMRASVEGWLADKGE